MNGIPNTTVLDVANDLIADAEHLCDTNLPNAMGNKAPNFTYVVWRELCATSPALLSHVPHVCGVIAYEEMVGPHAFSVVATMADEETLRNIANYRRPNEAVCSEWTSRLTSSDCELTVTVGWVDVADPLPATVSFRTANIFPKALKIAPLGTSGGSDVLKNVSNVCPVDVRRERRNVGINNFVDMHIRSSIAPKSEHPAEAGCGHQ